jgi:hypothetical protein
VSSPAALPLHHLFTTGRLDQPVAFAHVVVGALLALLLPGPVQVASARLALLGTEEDLAEFETVLVECRAFTPVDSLLREIVASDSVVTLVLGTDLRAEVLTMDESDDVRLGWSALGVDYASAPGVSYVDLDDLGRFPVMRAGEAGGFEFEEEGVPEWATPRGAILMHILAESWHGAKHRSEYAVAHEHALEAERGLREWAGRPGRLLNHAWEPSGNGHHRLYTFVRLPDGTICQEIGHPDERGVLTRFEYKRDGELVLERKLP